MAIVASLTIAEISDVLGKDKRFLRSHFLNTPSSIKKIQRYWLREYGWGEEFAQ